MGGANTQTQQFKPNSQNMRPDGTAKGSGFLGGMKRIDDPSSVSSEISIGVDWGSGEKLIPTMVPTLDNDEIKYLLSTPEDKIFTSNPELGKKIEQKAVRFAKERESKGLPFFAQPNESPKQPINIIGGANTQTQQPPQENPEKEAAKYDQLNKQGMSGSANESFSKYATGAKNLIKDIIGTEPTIPAAINEAQRAEQIKAQGMSGMHDESLLHYARMIKSLISESSNPNYNRDTKQAPVEKNTPVTSAGMRD